MVDSFEGNSACQAIDLLIQKGVPEAHIIFLNLISVSLLIQYIHTFGFWRPAFSTNDFTNDSINVRHLKVSIVFASSTQLWRSSPQRLMFYWMKNFVSYLALENSGIVISVLMIKFVGWQLDMHKLIHVIAGHYSTNVVHMFYNWINFLNGTQEHESAVPHA